MRADDVGGHELALVAGARCAPARDRLLNADWPGIVAASR